MSWATLTDYARIKYSQCGEEGVLERIFELIGETNRVSVEFGAGNGSWKLSNTRALHEKGWICHFWDCFDKPKSDEIKQHLVTVENVNELFAHYQIPHDLDLLSIDIDGNDYWVWHALRWQPRVVVIEFNCGLPPERKCTIPYDPAFQYDATDYCGASFSLLCQLGREKGYVPVCQLKNLNLFFVRDELVPVNQIPEVTYTQMQCLTPDPKKRPWLVFD